MPRPVWCDEPIEIVQLQFMRIRGQSDEVTDPEVTGPRLEVPMKRKRAQRGITAGAAARDYQLVAVDQAEGLEMPCAGNAIHHVGNSPLAVELFSISPSKSSAPPIVHVQDRKA